VFAGRALIETWIISIGYNFGKENA
jgi:hypothetical protein